MPKTSKPAPGRNNTSQKKTAAKAAARNTDSGPSRVTGAAGDAPSRKMADVDALVAAMPHNPTKPAEHGFANGVAPQAGATAEPASRLATGSTLSEANSNDKAGTVAPEGVNATIAPLDRVRVDSS